MSRYVTENVVYATLAIPVTIEYGMSGAEIQWAARTEMIRQLSAQNASELELTIEDAYPVSLPGEW